MYTTFHFSSADEISEDFIAAIKAAFKSKPIKLTVEEEVDETSYLLSSTVNKDILMESIEQYRKGQLVNLEGKSTD